MQAKFNNQIKQNFSFLLGKKLLIACSGGLDSVVLTHLMKNLNPQIALVHCNFSLRDAESDDDEKFVVGLANNLSIPVFTETFDTIKFAAEHKISTQMAARELRYNWFDELISEYEYDYLLTAHHLDDNLETFLINFGRGTGLSGLTGIPIVHNKIIRPLLNFSREEILQFAVDRNYEWREDSSNKKTDYLRNKLRLQVVPQLKETNEALLKNFQKTQRNLLASQNLIEDYMLIVFNLTVTQVEESYKIDVEKIKQLPHTEALLYELLHGFGFTEWDDVSNLLYAQTGKKLLSTTHQLLKNRNTLLLTKIANEKTSEEFLITELGSETPIKLEIKPTKDISEIGKHIIYVASEKLKFPLILRKWRKGDSFIPFGMTGRKKLSKFFKDERLSLNEKEKIWLLISEQKIVWVVGYRMDESFKVTDKTNQILKITFTNERV
ncbi:tRNA lysidine(34) synthetase TilS [Aequorivita sp. SDUM287046]|uniref:tRNA(Ile)-lysidine synthase n=1 Tax=Aequorivita aurantiaca TaxID=3053356 RepID=A0ABT8DFR9_9FLAO|nr:tRNA lysidine(34) synthetase TilS [Aequorivita aurantiaca]MDN3724068.1 tRNA lysidine(34) synthetase TilS [Aequorivita aurantiaca]